MFDRRTDLEKYKDAVWEFLLEHCEVTSKGVFVKFGAKGREDFERRITARLEGYHRIDPKAVEQYHLERRKSHLTQKLAWDTEKMRKIAQRSNKGKYRHVKLSDEERTALKGELERVTKLNQTKFSSQSFPSRVLRAIKRAVQ